MLKFHQIVLRKFIFIFSILFFIVGAIVYFWTKDFYVQQSKHSLIQNIEITSFKLNNSTNLDALAQKIKDTLSLRITVISEDGTVLAESHKDKSKMDNHKLRYEIIQANKENFGYKIRHSKTIDKNLLYVAKKYTHENKTTYIRMAKELNSINNEIISLGVKIFATLIIFFIAIFVITYNISKNIEKETLKIVTFLTIARFCSTAHVLEGKIQESER